RLRTRTPLVIVDFARGRRYQRAHENCSGIYSTLSLMDARVNGAPPALPAGPRRMSSREETSPVSHQPRPGHEWRLDRLHRHRVLDRARDAIFVEGVERLHVEPGILVAGAVEHVDAEWQVVGGEGPRPQHVEVLGADAVPGRGDRAGIGELPHLHIG